MKRLRVFGMSLAAASALLYAAFVFVSLEPNPAEWTHGWRAAAAYVAFFIAALATFTHQINE
jgi:hypothetical protein